MTSTYEKEELSPYSIEHSDILGRYLVANKDLKKGEIIFQELPIACGPTRKSTNIELQCPGCFNTSSALSCIECGIPICDMQCKGLERHAVECHLLAEHGKKKINSERDWNLVSDCIMSVRCLVLKKKNPSQWNILIAMESNWNQWKRSSLFPRANTLLQCIRKEFGLIKKEYSTDEILKVLAILDINCYEVRMPNCLNMQATYELSSICEHNCLPNTHKSISSETLCLTLRAATDISKGTHITTSYCDILCSTLKRQKFLRWSKFFICNCARCLDSTEFNSHLSSLLCPKCNNNNSAPVIPIFEPEQFTQYVWKPFKPLEFQCNLCYVTYSSELCQFIYKEAKEELDILDQDQVPEKCNEYEKWLAKWTVLNISPLTSTCNGHNDDTFITTANHLESHNQDLSPKSKLHLKLYPQNSLVLDACHTLFLLYGTEDESPTVELERKEALGIHLLNATLPIATGISRFRGTIIYELAMTKATLLLRHIDNDVKDVDMKNSANECLNMLRESIELLQYESLDQPEGVLRQTATKQLLQLECLLESLIPDLTLQQYQRDATTA